MAIVGKLDAARMAAIGKELRLMYANIIAEPALAWISTERN